MRTTLDIDDEALARALRFSDKRTKTSVINDALREYAKRRSSRELLEIAGKVSWAGDLDRLRKRSPKSKSK